MPVKTRLHQVASTSLQRRLTNRKISAYSVLMPRRKSESLLLLEIEILDAALSMLRSGQVHLPRAGLSLSEAWPRHRYSGRVRSVASPNAQRSISGGSTPKLVRAVHIWLR